MASEAQQNLEEMKLKVEISLFFGPALTAFDQEYRNKEKFLLLKSDMETNDCMIAVSLAETGLDTEMRKYDWINRNVHKGRKRLILIAPNYSDMESVHYLKEDLGVEIVKNVLELSL